MHAIFGAVPKKASTDARKYVKFVSCDQVSRGIQLTQWPSNSYHAPAPSALAQKRTRLHMKSDSGHEWSDDFPYVAWQTA